MDTFWDKLILVFITSVFGIVAAILTPRVLDWRRRRKLTADLIQELENLKIQISLQHLGYMRDLQFVTHGMIDGGQSVKFANTIYSNFYKDVCADLNASQRQSYELIHGFIESMNDLTQRQADLVHESMRGISAEIIVIGTHLAVAQYENIRILDWQIGYHLRNQKNPELGYMTETHREYLLKLEEIRNDIKKIMDAASKLDVTDIRHGYRPEDFKHLDVS